MKRLIALLLLPPALANATDSPCMQGCSLDITAGSMSVMADGGAHFNASGPGFTASGGWIFFGGPAPEGAFDISPGRPVSIFWGENSDDGFTMSVVVDGFGYNTGDPDPFEENGRSGSGEFEASSNTPITGAGTYKGTFSLDAFLGNDACRTSCKAIDVSGQGIATFHVVPEGSTGLFEVSNATFSFVGAPEPSAASLMLLGVAGLAVLGLRRGSRATLLPTG